MPDEIKLSCWVFGDEPDRIFTVQVKPTDTVHELKKAILKEKPSFKNIDADILELWEVQILAEDFYDDPDMLSYMRLDDCDKLRPWSTISQIWWSEPPLDFISVVLKRPIGGT